MSELFRAARYSRFSTEDQDSIADQSRVSGDYIAHEGWTLAASYSDEAKSGGDAGRSDYQRMKDDARRGLFDVIVVDEVSRLWRNNREQWDCYEELQYLGIHIVGVRDGIDTRREGHELLFAVRGGMNADFRRFVAKKVHESLRGRAIEGRNAAGRAYGYRIIYGQKTNPKSRKVETVPIGREIDEDQARWVRWIFERYAGGRSPEWMATELNRLGVRSPRGGKWSRNAIYGHRRKGTGILNNPLYVGRYIWNRSKWIDRPMRVRLEKQIVGRRERRERPQSEWTTADVPALRIVADELWQAVRTRQGAPKDQGGPSRGAPARTMLSGMLRCGVCGGTMMAVSQYLYGCAAKKNQGTCDGVYAPRRAVEDVVLAAIREDILSDAACQAMQQHARDVLRERKKTAGAASEAARQRFAVVEREVANLVEAIAACGASEALRTRLATAEAECARLRKEAAGGRDTMAPDIIPRLLEKYRAEVAGLSAMAKENPAEARAIIRDLVSEVRLVQDDDGIYAELGGVYEGLLASITGKSLNGVAGEGFCIRRRVRAA